jgi:uncharacterized protein (TIGR03437 family)
MFVNRFVVQLTRIVLITSIAGVCSGQVPSGWRTFDGTDYSFKYPPNWQVDRVSDQELRFGPAGGAPLFGLVVTTEFGGDIERFMASEKAAYEQVAARERWSVTARTDPGLRGGIRLAVDLATNTGRIAVTGLALGVGRGPLYYLMMISTPERNFSDYEQLFQPIVNSLVLKLRRGAIEGSWQRSQENYAATLIFRSDGTYGYLVRQTRGVSWDLEVEGRYALSQPNPNSASDRLAMLELAPSSYRFSAGLPSSSQPAEVIRLMAEGFPAITSEPFEVLCVQRLNLVLKARQPGLGNWQPMQAQPSTSSVRVVSSATFREGAVAPGSLISVFGDFGARESAATSLPLPSSLSGVSVTIAGRAAPLHYTGLNQINAQVPFDVPAGTAAILVTANARTLSGSAQIARTAPAIFISSGNRAVAANQNYTLNTPANPAPPGSYVTVYITGQGAFRTPVATGAGAPSNPLAYTFAETTASIGGRTTEVSYSGGAPGLAGVGQVNVRVPSGINAGDQQLVITIGGVSSDAAVVSVSR